MSENFTVTSIPIFSPTSDPRKALVEEWVLSPDTLPGAHANPAHSALRRARHFIYAVELHEFGDRDWFDSDAWKAARLAASESLWSVR